MPKSTLRHFDQSLNLLKNKISCMTEMVENAVQRSTDALFEGNREKAEIVKRNDYDIDMLEIDIDEIVHELIVLHQPTAKDLRFITMSMKVTNDLERMGDHATNIASRVISLCKEPHKQNIPAGFAKLVTATRKIVCDAVNAFIRGDVTLAESVLKGDDEIDDLYNHIYQETRINMEALPFEVTNGLHMISIGNNLERIADLATNIAEDVIFAQQGKDVRHHIGH